MLSFPPISAVVAALVDHSTALMTHADHVSTAGLITTGGVHDVLPRVLITRRRCPRAIDAVTGLRIRIAVTCSADTHLTVSEARRRREVSWARNGPLTDFSIGAGVRIEAVWIAPIDRVAQSVGIQIHVCFYTGSDSGTLKRRGYQGTAGEPDVPRASRKTRSRSGTMR